MDKIFIFILNLKNNKILNIFKWLQIFNTYQLKYNIIN